MERHSWVGLCSIFISQLISLLENEVFCVNLGA